MRSEDLASVGEFTLMMGFGNAGKEVAPVISEAMETVTKTLRVEFQPIEFRPTCYQGSGLLKRSR